jgi:glycine/D-amino acid oxidase-like deaminating enzyme
MTSPDFVVVGGGIAGCSLAYELVVRGATVRLFERESLAAAASGLSPGNLLALDADPRIRRMRDVSVKAYLQLGGGPPDPRLEEVDQLQIAVRTEDLARLDQLRVAAAGIGLDTEPLDPGDLRARFPGLAPEIVGGLLVPGATVIHSAAATRAFAEAARARGAVFTTDCQITRVAVEGGRASGVLTDTGRTAAGAVVLANGPWLIDLLPTAPIGTTRGWLLKVTGVAPGWPMVREVRALAASISGQAEAPTAADLVAGVGRAPSITERFLLRPLGDGSGLVGNLVADSFGEQLTDADACGRLARLLSSRAPGLAKAQVIDAWSALRPMTPDELPLVGPAAMPGLYLHAGHGHYGMMSAPATAAWLAESLLGIRHAPELADLAPARYGI